MTHTLPRSYLLKGIVDTQVADSIAWLPQTFAWTILFWLLAFAFLAGMYHAFRRYQKNQYRRDALHQLAQINRADTYDALCALLHIVKHVAVHLDNNNASKTDDDLLNFFEVTKTRSTPSFHRALNQRAFKEVWQPKDQCTFNSKQIDDLCAQFKTWIRHHCLDKDHLLMSEGKKHD
ncbi:hypothetical protein PCNPT3_07025 [Psychromonas sp. CNPT3]|uniref:DUF4381 domain-containing protein n=1 Tax=Psychromonas sp. CNPT3 TaxID=314282 RepID=UPI00006E3C10|nr:DUF4381 domain-containing protein [Psychromonas sp. CNPT3]AGH81343.1 hypothetical protein PCNPT3_07025 [Psychromonas sp. CNPT3]